MRCKAQMTEKVLEIWSIDDSYPNDDFSIPEEPPTYTITEDKIISNIMDSISLENNGPVTKGDLFELCFGYLVILEIDERHLKDL